MVTLRFPAPLHLPPAWGRADRSGPTPLPRLLPGLLGLALAVLAGTALAVPAGSRIPLECRLGDGPWRDCVMEIEQIGGHWWLLIDGQRFEFRHDGRGTVRMKGEQPPWRTVTSSWQEDASLCWDGVCAKGDIPLD